MIIILYTYAPDIHFTLSKQWRVEVQQCLTVAVIKRIVDLAFGVDNHRL